MNMRQGDVNNDVLGKSLDEIDLESYHPGPAPFSGPLPRLVLSEKADCDTTASDIGIISLDGDWILASSSEDGLPDWASGIPAAVPGSVHTALLRSGRIPDPTVGINQQIARTESYKRWWYKKTFKVSQGLVRPRIVFAGVANRCTCWLNGVCLGKHEGMFGGPEYDVENMLQQENELIVMLDPIDFEPAGRYPENNASWQRTVVVNNVYGWHYSNMPSLGIWRSVRLESIPEVALINPFVTTLGINPAKLALSVSLSSSAGGIAGMLCGVVSPENFAGTPVSFSHAVRSEDSVLDFKAVFEMPDPRLWWPVDLGEPNLYRLILTYYPDNRNKPCCVQVIFGVRTVETAPLPDGPSPELYNWNFIINGRPAFVKGTGWCTADAMLDFSVARLDRFLTLARSQHCQMLRAWGSGMPETDEFYDLCDRYGIMVLQEWPTAWNSHRTQPMNLLEETVRRNTYRLRNHPSLVMWGAGNESDQPFGEAIDMMGRLSVELDGSRPFHRGEPWGGSSHDYTCYWDYAPLDHNLNMTSRFFGEFGLACLPSCESVLRYLAPEDGKKWPMANNQSLKYHTPIFGYADDVNRIMQYARYFVEENAPLHEVVLGSQLSQVVGVRHTLERARTRWPICGGALYYKLNDNFPAASWSCVDWYGAPKMSHYFFQDAFAPLSAVVLFNSVNSVGTNLSLPVFLLDDANALARLAWEVAVRAYDAKLNPIARLSFTGEDSVESPKKLGQLVLSADQTRTAPLFVTADICVDGVLSHRNYYFINYEHEKGCLFRLPRASFVWSSDSASGTATIINDGAVPAVAVQVGRPNHLHEFAVSDNYFWLEPGESATVNVNSTDGLTVSALNSI